MCHATNSEMCGKKDKNAVDKLLAQLVIVNNISFDVVQTTSIICFVQGVAEYGPDYKLPSYLTFQRKLIPYLKVEVEEYARNVKKSCEKFIESRKMKDGINFILENLVAIEEREDFMKEVQLYRNKVPSLFTITANTMLKTSHPRIWWDFCGDRLPILQKLNSMMMEKFNTGESRNLEPIDLYKPYELPEYVDHEQFLVDDAFSRVVEKSIDD
ncbi:hypothetical protein CMV_008089 [Castanea mollissima]|uniref:HAT C-terminal dimerisation domain-containing protein n=1 Tax=Castanea mollissima TaxID=60419 RepID=A0A8J4VS50_9ROSI|nr:hypothetical protein CMV_008089 [Castanea mollissima]